MRARGSRPGVWLLVCAALPFGIEAQSGAGSRVGVPPGADRIWGVVTTVEGDRFEGFLRWDLNEASWPDALHGLKTPDRDLQDRIAESLGEDLAIRGRSVEYLGVRITWEDDGDLPGTRSNIRFGHLAWLDVDPDSNEPVLLGLKSGEELRLTSRSSDLGATLRGFVVDEPGRGSTELDWADLDRIDFRPAPSDARPAAYRLHGTVEDRWGDRWTGFISWDLDESLSSDVLDGEEDGRDREIEFDQIATVQRRMEGGARVTLADGRELVLEGTNDVDDGHRGIQVSDPGLGLIDLEWDDVRRVSFSPPDAPVGYDAFDGGRRIHGSVSTEAGETLTGRVIWDADESWTWETLDGSGRGRSFEVEFMHIARIERRSSRGATVTLVDGRTLDLEDSTDVDDSNRGIVVELGDGTLRVVEWDEFESVSLDRGGR